MTVIGQKLGKGRSDCVTEGLKKELSTKIDRWGEIERQSWRRWEVTGGHTIEG